MTPLDLQVTHAADAAVPAAVGRRHLLGIGAASLLPLLIPGVAAAAPPKRPTGDDVEVLGGLQRLELTLRELYDEAIAGVDGWTDQQAVVMTALREAHEEFANALSALLGNDAPGKRSEIAYATLRTAAKGTPDEVLVGMWGAESSAVATHLAALGALQGIDGAALTSAIQIAEARHCTMLAALAGLTDRALLLVDDEADSLEVKG